MGERQRFFRSPQELIQAAINALFPHEKMQVPKRQSRFRHIDGPMYYIGQQIVKAMEDAGYPAKILYCHRSAAQQRQLYAKGRTAPGNIVTKAGPWDSAHQYYEAVDIIHPSKAWDVSEAYWETLASCTRIVAEKFGVELEHGHDWDFRDSAHIELKDWRKVRDRHQIVINSEGKERPPNHQELWNRFCEVLPDVAKRLVIDLRVPKNCETPKACLPKPRQR